MTEIKRIKCKTVNCYIVSQHNSSVLVDTGEAGYEQKIYRECRGKNVRLLVLTHGHVDHIQNTSFLAKKLRIPVAMSKKDYELVHNQFAQPLEGAGLFGKGLAAVSKRKMKKSRIEGFAPEIFLSEGDSLNDFGVQALVMEVPGHTEGSIALAIDGQGIIVGDTLMNMPYPKISYLYSDKEKLQHSARRISALGPKTIYFGHGAPSANRDWLSHKR